MSLRASPTGEICACNEVRVPRANMLPGTWWA